MSAFCCAWRPHRSTDEDSSSRSMQLCCRWAVNLKCATCTTAYCVVCLGVCVYSPYLLFCFCFAGDSSLAES